MKIVIVEDEIRIREGVVKLIRKIPGNHEIAGCAEDGETGIRLIQESSPDLVITDIRMEKMNGLEMLSALKERGPMPKVIILSAYSDFEYARKAMKLGVSEYILKPISVVEFTNSFKSMEQQIANEKEQKHSVMFGSSFESIMQQVLYYDFQKEENLQKVLWEEHQFFTEENCCIIPIYLGWEYEQSHKKIAREMHAIWREKSTIRHYVLELEQKNMLAVLLSGYEDARQVERWFQNRIAQRFSKYDGEIFSIGWAESEGIGKLKPTYKLLTKWMEWSIVLGTGVVISYPKVTDIQTVPVVYPISIEKDMRESICAMNRENIEKNGKRFLNYFSQSILYSPQEIKESFVRFVWSILGVIKEVHMDCYEQIEQQIMLDHIMSAMVFRELETSLTNLIALVSRFQNDISRDSFLIQRMKSMVYEFYNQGITLDEIAIKLQMTPEYLGTLFHKEVGETYSSFFKKHRIEKAKKLLLGTNLKIYEIAEQVGYHDSKYFSKVFKEMEGELPADYRKTH